MNQKQLRGFKMRCLRTPLAAFLVLAAFCGQASAINDIVAQWTFEINTPADLSDSANGPTVAAEAGAGSMQGVHASALADWTTPAGNGSANSYSVTNWAVNDYTQFQTSTIGLADIGLQFDHVSSTTGPRDFKVQWSTNGSAFTDFASYIVQPNAAPAWSSAGPVTPIGLDTFTFDMRSVAALDGATDVYFRLTNTSTASANGTGTVPATGTSRVDNVTIYNNFDPTTVVPQPPPAPVLPVAGDVVFGTNANRAKTTLQLVRGPASGPGATPTPYSPWQSTPFIQSVEFDNLGGTKHNVNGNLLGVDFGVAATGGAIHSFATQGAVPAPAGQLIGNTTGTGETAVATTRLAGLSVSPNNSKIALSGFDSGKVIVYDYTAGNSMGSGASLSGGRESAATLTTVVTQGTTWVDDSTVLTLSTAGSLFKVDATSMAVTPVGPTLAPPSIGASTFTSLTYNPGVSPYVWAMSSTFAVTPESVLYVLDPANNYALIDQATYTTSTDSSREIALDAAGNLFIGGNGSDISVVLGAAASALTASLADDNAVFWYNAPLFLTGASFNGLDVGLAAASLAGDYNNNGTVDAADYVVWRNGDSPDDTLAGYNLWKANFGKPPGAGSGSGLGAVPEPGCAVLVLLGCVSLLCGRRATRR